jgi:hypothetical protein
MWLAQISVAGCADEADHLAPGEGSALRKAAAIRFEMSIVVHEALRRVGGVYREPTLAIPLQPENSPVIGGQNRCSARCRDVDGAVDSTAAAWGSKVGGDLVRRYASDRHHELSRAEGLRDRRLPPADKRASGDETCEERKDAASPLLSPDGTRARDQRPAARASTTPAAATATRADGRDPRGGRRRAAHLVRFPRDHWKFLHTTSVAA